MLFNHAFDGGIFRVGFFGIGQTSIRSTIVTGKLALARFSVQQTEGLKVGCGGMGGFKEWADGRV